MGGGNFGTVNYTVNSNTDRTSGPTTTIDQN